ncbi:hypothetical protein JD844_012517, partial [Phrynosoma platyrhinos]
CPRAEMELLCQTPSNKLDAYITEHLLPSREFQENVQDAVHRICTFLKERCSMDARVIKTVKSCDHGSSRSNSKCCPGERLGSVVHGSILLPKHAMLQKRQWACDLLECAAAKGDLLHQRAGMELLYQTPSNKLDAYITTYLLPSREFRENVQNAVHRICSFLKERCSMDARVIKTVKVSLSSSLLQLETGTTLDDNSDADLVIFLSCFSNYRDQAAKRASVIHTIEQNLLRCHMSLAFNIDILPPQVKGPISQDKYKPPSKVYTDLIQAGGKPGEFNTSFTELQRNFVKHCPAKVKGLLRLVKHWYKECKKDLKERDASVSLPPKFALELLTIYAWEEGTGRAEQFSTAEGFCTVMNLLIQYQELCIYWTEYYSLEEPIIGAHVREHLRGQRPVIMDPADPTANVALGKGWDRLSKEASFCLSMPCCRKGSGPVTSWNVQVLLTHVELLLVSQLENTPGRHEFGSFSHVMFQALQLNVQKFRCNVHTYLEHSFRVVYMCSVP